MQRRSGAFGRREFQLFVRDARRAARQALYFLYMLEDAPAAEEATRTGDLPAPAVRLLEGDSADFAGEQVATILDAVHIPENICQSRGMMPWTARLSLADWRARVEERKASPRVRGHFLRAQALRLLALMLALATSKGRLRPLRRWLARLIDLMFEHDGSPAKLFELHDRLAGGRGKRNLIHELLDMDSEAADGAQYQANHPVEVHVVRFWARRVWEISRQERKQWLGDAAQCQHLIWQLQAFLRITRPRGLHYLTHLAVRCGRLLHRNLAATIGLILAIGIYALDPICSLVRNGGIWGYLAAVAPIVLGSFVVRIVPGNRKAFFRLAFPVEYPDHGIELWRASCSVRRRAEWRTVANSVLLVMVWTLVAALFAAIRPHQPTLQTIVYIVGCLAMSVVALHWIDTWEFLDARPIRALFLVAAGAAVVFGLFVEEERTAVLWPSLVVLALSTALMVGRAWRRRDPIAPDAPARRVSSVFGMVLTAAAAVLVLWAGVAHLREDDWQRDAPFQPVTAAEWPAPGVDGKGAFAPELPIVLVAASGGGSRAAMYTALTLEQLHRDLPEIAANIQAISSVSGGSLGSAAYIRARLDGALCMPGDSCKPEPQERDLGVVATRVGGDFLRPTLTGALAPWLSRASSIEQSWASEVELRQLRLSDLVSEWRERRDGKKAPLPLPLFNSASLDGHAVVISPLSARAYTPPATGGGDALPCIADRSRENVLRQLYGLTDEEPLTWVLDRDAVYSLEQIDDRFDPKLTSAVRASANFPFGFPLVRLALGGRCQGVLPHGLKKVALTDGGVLSNSGVWTLFHLLTGAKSGVRPEEAGPVESKLRKRGVLLLVIDASHMPLYAAKSIAASRLYGAIRDQAPVAQNLHRKMFELLKYRYGDALRIVQIDLVPRIADNVYTTWALDSAARQKLVASFRRVWGRDVGARVNARQAIDCSWWRLKKRQASGTVSDRKDCPDQPERLAAGDMPEGSYVLRPPLD